MAKYETQQAQAEALKILDNFDVNFAGMSLNLDDPLQGIRFTPSSSEVAQNVTVIAKSMVVEGNIKTDSPIAVKGTVNGDITTQSDIGVSGLVSGDIKAENIDFNHAAIKGNATAEKEINLENHSVVIGDLCADKVTIDGKVKGNAKATNTMFFKSNALMVGTVVAGGINMEDGSRVSATITLTNKELASIDDSEFELEV